MTPKDFAVLSDATFNRLKALSAVKSGEYATDADKLANFREASARLGLTPEQVLLVYLDKHYAAVTNFIKDQVVGKTRPRSEPIEGRVHDMMVYLLLFMALLSESRQLTSTINDSPSLSFDDDDV